MSIFRNSHLYYTCFTCLTCLLICPHMSKKFKNNKITNEKVRSGYKATNQTCTAVSVAKKHVCHVTNGGDSWWCRDTLHLWAMRKGALFHIMWLQRSTSVRIHNHRSSFSIWTWCRCNRPNAFSCSTQLSMKFILLMNVKMPTNVGILTFISRIKYKIPEFNSKRNLNFQHYIFMSYLGSMLS